jgi:hypothetical protein
MEGQAWPVMPGVKPAASGDRNLADWHVKGWSLTCGLPSLRLRS